MAKKCADCGLELPVANGRPVGVWVGGFMGLAQKIVCASCYVLKYASNQQLKNLNDEIQGDDNDYRDN